MENKFLNAYKFPSAKHVVVSGDIHGAFTELVFRCCMRYGMTDTLIIVAGDCGFGFERPGYYEDVYKQCSKRLSKANNWLVFVRGNHDNPAYFNKKPIKHRRWMTLPDYSVVNACGHAILCVGGAISIDRMWRMTLRPFHLQRPAEPLIPNVYWVDEAPFYDESQLDVIHELYAIDTVISHTSPSFCELVSHQGIQNWAIRDEKLMADVKAERSVMDQLHSYLITKNHSLRSWYYGHFHQSWHAKIDGVMFHLLDIMELSEL